MAPKVWNGNSEPIGTLTASPLPLICQKQGNQKGSATPKGSRTVRNLFQSLEEGECSFFNHGMEESVCINLLKAMEIEELCWRS
jgi:hypothetical protein